jgi:hypothetical protein
LQKLHPILQNIIKIFSYSACPTLSKISRIHSNSKLGNSETSREGAIGRKIFLLYFEDSSG